jgi:hypothetical protein
MERATTKSGTALDLLEREDIALRSAFVQVQVHSGRSIEERSEYGDLAKSVIRHVATREVALVDVAEVVADVPELTEVSERFHLHQAIRRAALDRVEKMSRGVPGVNLNKGQDFGKEFTHLMQIVGTEIEWDLEEGLPAVRNALEERDRMDELTSAEKLAEKLSKRAPTNLGPPGSR